jgi:formate dehydrogenase major subunit
MKINRRKFLKISIGTAAGVMALGLGMDMKPVKSYAQTLKIRYAKETTTICPYCAVGHCSHQQRRIRESYQCRG